MEEKTRKRLNWIEWTTALIAIFGVVGGLIFIDIMETKRLRTPLEKSVLTELSIEQAKLLEKVHDYRIRQCNPDHGLHRLHRYQDQPEHCLSYYTTLDLETMLTRQEELKIEEHERQKKQEQRKTLAEQQEILNKKTSQ